MGTITVVLRAGGLSADAVFESERGGLAESGPKESGLAESGRRESAGVSTRTWAGDAASGGFRPGVRAGAGVWVWALVWVRAGFGVGVASDRTPRSPAAVRGESTPGDALDTDGDAGSARAAEALPRRGGQSGSPSAMGSSLRRIKAAASESPERAARANH
ncbi:MAG: hypothetical protein ACPGUC_03950 [Gammaproteobacteria bacterium]